MVEVVYRTEQYCIKFLRWQEVSSKAEVFLVYLFIQKIIGIISFFYYSLPAEEF